MKKLFYLILFLTICSHSQSLMELDNLRQAQINAASGGGTAPVIPVTSGLIVDLNEDTMLTTGDVPATVGQKVVNWSNAITGNTISGATQATATDQPVLKIASDGRKEVDFSGSNNYKLSFGTLAALDFQQTGVDFTVIMQSGDGDQDVFWISDLSSSTTRNGGFAIDFFGSTLFYMTGITFSGTSQAQPSVSTVLAVTREEGVNTKLYFNNTERQSINITSFIGSTQLPLLIGSSNNNTSNAFTGSFKRVLIYDRVLTPTELTSVYDALTQ